MKRTVSLGLLSLLAACAASENEVDKGNAALPGRELIVLAPPPDGDVYYADQLDSIFEFHVEYARKIADQDDVLVLSGSDRYNDYVAALGPDKVVRIEMQDIWMRDFSLSNAANPVMFRYTSEGQGGGKKGQSEADTVQEVLASALEAAGLVFGESDLLNDGGNFVDDYAGNVVISRKFLRDNALDEDAGRDRIKKITGATNIAFIEADEQGGLEHADGVVAFIDGNTLVINSYPEDTVYAAALRSDLLAGLPGVTIYEIVTPYDGSKIYDQRFGSACGLYTNMLVTPHRIYLPQFGIPEDAEALANVRKWTSREVVPVQSRQVCNMGGGVRCMSWQLRGANAAALLAHAARQE